jgi:hypothetical protein
MEGRGLDFWTEMDDGGGGLKIYGHIFEYNTIF